MGRIRQLAHSQAKAEYGPQMRRVRRETGSAVRSIRSEVPALEAAIALAQQQIGHAGLTPVDRALATSELAHRNVDVASSAALQIGDTRRTAHQELVDLAQGQGQEERSLLATLQHEALKRHQDILDSQRSNAEEFRLGILKAEALNKLGLTSSGSSTGLTPTQARSHNQSKHNAAFYAHQYVVASKNGIKDPKTGETLIPAGPHTWDDSVWNNLIEKVAKSKGVGSVTDAQHAVQAIRDHFQPTAGASPLLGALGTVARAAIPALAPQSLAPIAELGASILQHHRR